MKDVTPDDAEYLIRQAQLNAPPDRIRPLAREMAQVIAAQTGEQPDEVIRRVTKGQ